METANMEVGHIDIIKVSATSRTSAVAGAIAGVVREHQKAEVQAIGASAVNSLLSQASLRRYIEREIGPVGQVGEALHQHPTRYVNRAYQGVQSVDGHSRV